MEALVIEGGSAALLHGRKIPDRKDNCVFFGS